MKILGTRIDHVNMQEAIERATEGMNNHPPFIVVTPNSEIVVKANQEERLMNIIDHAGLVVPDGIGLVIGSKLVGQALKERVTGIDLMMKLVEYAEKNHCRVFLLGGKPSIAERAGEKLLEQFPKLNLVGTHHGYFKGAHIGAAGHEEEQKVIEQINSLDVDMLFVALGAPSQEYFIEQNKDKLGAKLLMGVGGSFDVISGTVQRAPERWQKMGLEWLYRLIKEPWRIKRAGALPVFAINVLIHRDKPMQKKK